MRRLVERELPRRMQLSAPVRGAVDYLRDIQFKMKDVRKFEDLMTDFLASRKAALPKEVVDEISSLATRTGNDLEEWRARIDTIIDMLQQGVATEEGRMSVRRNKLFE